MLVFYFSLQKPDSEPGMLAQACKPALRRLKQIDGEIKARGSLHIVSLPPNKQETGEAGRKL